MSWSLLAVAAACAAPLVSCRTEDTLVTPDPHLQRMVTQPKAMAYGEDPALPHGMVMQLPPEGTLPVDAIAGDPLVSTGAEGPSDASTERWATRIPIRVDRALVVAGRRHFDVFCAPCHGALGDGTSIVAEKMTLRPPPSLLDADARESPVGRIFEMIRNGYGLMPSYAAQLSVEETWGVTAYVRALQIARGTPVGELPPELRAEHARHAR
ncbi:MAG: cytochrome c [Polyangiaceae bacterium]|nr:cytochrome c [Polyangiaceae bacterium]